MTLEEMAARLKIKPTPKLPPSTAVDATQYKVAERVIEDTAEPWLLEQLEHGNCPSCGARLTCLYTPKYAPSTWFYTCTTVPTQHRWWLIKTKED